MGTHSLQRHRRPSQRGVWLIIFAGALVIGGLAGCKPDNGSSWDSPDDRVTPTPAGAASADLGIALCGSDGVGGKYHATVRAFNHGNVTYDYAFTLQWVVRGTIEDTVDTEIRGVNPKTSKDGRVTSNNSATETAGVICKIKNAHRSG